MGQDLVAPGVHEIDVLVLDGDWLEGVDQPYHEVPGSLSSAHLRFRPLADGYEFDVLVVKGKPGGPVARRTTASIT